MSKLGELETAYTNWVGAQRSMGSSEDERRVRCREHQMNREPSAMRIAPQPLRDRGL